MHILTCTIGESVRIGMDIKITALHIRGDRVRFRVSMPDDIHAYREEIVDTLNAAIKRAVTQTTCGT
jgi:carbon storage regulator CsrA